jgi:ATP-dependent Clp protease adaptor protein ClpS
MSFPKYFEKGDTLELDEVDVLDNPVEKLGAKLVVFNDEVNSFDWVIECFVKVLRHTAEQAEQLSYMIHFRGKAIVKNGTLEELRPFKDALCERGLSAVIEE